MSTETTVPTATFRLSSFTNDDLAILAGIVAGFRKEVGKHCQNAAAVVFDCFKAITLELQRRENSEPEYSHVECDLPALQDMNTDHLRTFATFAQFVANKANELNYAATAAFFGSMTETAFIELHGRGEQVAVLMDRAEWEATQNEALEDLFRLEDDRDEKNN